MAKSLDMTKGSPLRLLFLFSLPLMFGNVFLQLYTVVDTAIVGQGVGLQALAALGTVDWLNWLFLGVAQGYTQGFSVRISQKFGQGDLAGLKKVAGQSAFLCAIFAVIGTAIGQLMLPVFFVLLRVPANLQNMASTYVRLLLAGFPAVVFFNYCASLLRAIGNSKTPLYAMIVASLANIFLDYLAVFTLDWGIAGAAIATVIAQCLSGVVCIMKIRKMPQLHFQKEDLLPQGAVCKDLLLFGSPVATKNIIIALGGMAVQTVVNKFDLSFIAGFTATNKLYGLLEIAATSYGYGLTTYVGQNFGAIKLDRVKKGISSATLLAVATSLVIATLMLVFGRSVTMIFISQDDPILAKTAGDIAYQYLCTMCISLPILYLLYVYQAGLQGMSNTVMPMISGIIEFVLRVSLSLLVGVTGYQKGIFGAEVSAWWGASIFLMLSYFSHYRKYCIKNGVR